MDHLMDYWVESEEPDKFLDFYKLWKKFNSIYHLQNNIRSTVAHNVHAPHDATGDARIPRLELQV